MAADYPSSIRNFLVLYDGVDKVIANHPNYRGDEITALQTLVGAFGTGQANLTDLRNLLLNYIDDCKLTYTSVASVTVAAGKIVITDASGNCRWRKNTSPVVVTWADIDTGAEANDTYYIYAVADNVGTTFTIMISLNSTTPTGATFYRKIGSFVNSAGDIERDSVVMYPANLYTYFGEWETKVNDTIYQALTDGFICAYRGPDGAMTVLTDSSTPPTTIRGRHADSGADADDSYGSSTVPVKKGDYWKTTGASNVFWIPIKL